MNQSDVNQRLPIQVTRGKSWVGLVEWPNLALVPQDQNTVGAQSFGIFTKTGSVTPIFSAFSTASS